MNIKLDDSTHENLQELLRRMNASRVEYVDELTLTSFVGMLLDDAAMVVTRPGCWEASNIHQVLISHGYLHG